VFAPTLHPLVCHEWRYAIHGNSACGGTPPAEASLQTLIVYAEGNTGWNLKENQTA